MASSSDQEKETSQKYKHGEVHKLNTYNKRALLEILVENGCTEKSFDEIKKKLKKIKPGAVEEYVTSRAYDAQMHVHEECDLKMLGMLDKWADYFKEIAFSEECQYDIPLAFQAIAEIEQHPPPSVTGGIDFCHLYTFLADVMRGNPTVQLDEHTRNFLKEVFEELQMAVDSEEGIKECKKLKSTIIKNANIITVVESRDELPRSLDPLNVEIQ